MVRVLLSPVIKVINHMNQVPMCVLLKQAVGWWFVQTSFRFHKSFRSDHWSTIRGRWVPRSDMMTGWPWLKWNTLTRFGHRCTSSSKFQPEILGRPGVSSALQVHENTTKYLGDPTTHTWNKFCDDNSWLKCIHSFSNTLDQEFFMFFYNEVWQMLICLWPISGYFWVFLAISGYFWLLDDLVFMAVLWTLSNTLNFRGHG